MRSFIINQFFPNGGYILFGYIMLSFFLFWKGKLNLKNKSRHIRDEIQVIEWDKSMIWMNRFVIPLLLTILLVVYSLDWGWLIDLIVIVGVLFLILVFIGSLSQERIFVRMSSISVVPLFGNIKDIHYNEIEKVEIIKKENDKDSEESDKWSLKVLLKADTVKISEKRSEIESFLAAVKDKISGDKFEVKNETTPLDSQE